MSADPIVQDPTDTQSLNRYSYVSNNPLSYTDPTGYFSLGKIFKAIIAIVVVIVAIYFGQGWLVQAGLFAETGVGTAIVAGGIGGAIAGGITGGGDLKSILIGAVSGAAFGALGASDISGVTEVVAYGTTGGVTSVAQGGNFQSGFLAAAFGALAGPKVEAFAEAAGSETAQIVAGTAASAVAGGIGSVLGGGKFANGAVTGAFSYAVGRALQPSEAANDNWENAKGRYAANDNGTMNDASSLGLDLGTGSRFYDSLKVQQCIADCTSKHFGLADAAELGAAAAPGTPIPKKWVVGRTGTGGASEWTSVSSALANKYPALAFKIPGGVRVLNTTIALRLLGRLAGPISVGMAVYDVGAIGVCARECINNARR